MMQIRRGVLTVLAAGLFALLPQSGDSLAIGLQVTPGKLEVSIPAGVTYNVPITVHSSSFSSTHVQATMIDFGVSQSGDYQFLKVGESPYTLMRWAFIRPREFDLAPGTTQQVQLTIAVPSDSKLSGEYAGMIFFQTRPERHGGGVAFSARVASKIYETIPNTVKIDGAITKMSTAKSRDGQVFRVVFHNTGNAHIYANGQLIVQRGNSVVYQVAMPAGMLVERNGIRVIEVKGKTLEPGSYQAIATVDYGGKTETGGQITFDVH